MGYFSFFQYGTGCYNTCHIAVIHVAYPCQLNNSIKNNQDIASPYFWPRLLLCKLSYTFPWFALARASIFSSQLLALAVINQQLIVKLLDDHEHLFRLGNRSSCYCKKTICSKIFIQKKRKNNLFNFRSTLLTGIQYYSIVHLLQTVWLRIP